MSSVYSAINRSVFALASELMLVLSVLCWCWWLNRVSQQTAGRGGGGKGARERGSEGWMDGWMGRKRQERERVAVLGVCRSVAQQQYGSRVNVRRVGVLSATGKITSARGEGQTGGMGCERKRESERWKGWRDACCLALSFFGCWCWWWWVCLWLSYSLTNTMLLYNPSRLTGMPLLETAGNGGKALMPVSARIHAAASQESCVGGGEEDAMRGWSGGERKGDRRSPSSSSPSSPSSTARQPPV
ncbi:hypothetical protein EX30DRAFT_122886 [Ascodesmis nigricans]|uniref:Uncharacterized protein n=1 Tax=Ascodesmis nigricans TaxID=341454 RepID=A0A4S2MSK9_9PEZI|nr:hypothetical protein EX30DRAFT_122886 [Ascodesmis nigricans]